MGNNDPMFDLEDCEDVEFHNNKTSSNKLLKAKNTKNIKASNNESSSKTKAIQNIWHETAFGKVIIGLIIGVILLIASLILN